MRLLASSLLLLSSFQTFAAELPKDYSLHCTTSVAGVNLYAEGDRFHFHLSDGAGFQNFPVYSGVVTPSLASLITRGIKELAAFDGEVDITWDLAKCKVDPKRPFLISCSGLGEILNPAKVAFVATSMGTSTDKIQSLDVDAQAVNVFFGLSTADKDFMHYFVNFPFDSQHCSLGKK